ncbi:MAG: aldehyde dehydrogenase [Burkholderiales bacterium RIFCSPLOWO2_12_67_14]|nr:MAG: aldehyde dehydrogenase [Burkholderiales bacterium RIFCSPLOWO2_02_FULL_67_64]OGB44466.1 MAG: aldehyde dehydrogenase [Burkholderiales bacterium RIFCSPHIGHO2_12_FULL_67_38]OGB50516.1 MAG: aldehyde dehydrogenase [Burkholderiales bacterium RIFCSPLOWO2_12_67_14]OGB78692.1 MAG: aldehyde dehydrogenase [Burkholderiales bacterium RIFCSPLOWO2_12_FULL_67_210]
MDNRDIVKTLNSLIETSKDGEYGFRLSAEHARSEQIKLLFLARAGECAQAASELQTLVLQYGGKAETSGSATGSLHRGWVAVKGTLAGYSDLNMLEEAERGEDAALEQYRNALRQVDLPGEVRSLVERQFQGAKDNHDQIRDLREQARASSH